MIDFFVREAKVSPNSLLDRIQELSEDLKKARERNPSAKKLIARDLRTLKLAKEKIRLISSPKKGLD